MFDISLAIEGTLNDIISNSRVSNDCSILNGFYFRLLLISWSILLIIYQYSWLTTGLIPSFRVGLRSNTEDIDGLVGEVQNIDSDFDGIEADKDEFVIRNIAEYALDFAVGA